jgi:hypothetical protein
VVESVLCNFGGEDNKIAVLAAGGSQSAGTVFLISLKRTSVHEHGFPCDAALH